MLYQQTSLYDIDGNHVLPDGKFADLDIIRTDHSLAVLRNGALNPPVADGKTNSYGISLDWQTGEALSRGVWNIPIPAERRPCVPDIVISPVVGYDPACYRLGYGGGFFDRTLAALPARPRVIGIGYSSARLRTIHPQAHDIPMDLIVTEAGTVRPQADVSTVRALT